MKITTVLFDFDGTIMNTNQVIINSWQHTFRFFEGKERPLEHILKTFGEPLDLTMKGFFPDIPIDESIEVYRSYHRDNFGKAITVFPGMRELLERLIFYDFKLALITSRLRETTWQGLEKYDLAQFFQTVVTCEDTEIHKPNPEPLFCALSRMSKKPSEAIMVGDTMNDIRCARNSGVISVLAGWSIAVGDNEKTGLEAPAYVINKAEDLLKLLGEINNSSYSFISIQ